MQGSFRRWLYINFGVGLIPVMLNLVLIGITDISFSLAELLGKGELLMLAAGLSLGVVADFTFAEAPTANALARSRRNAAVRVCTLTAVGAVGVYGMLLMARASDVEVIGFWVAVVSLAPYLVSVGISGYCTLAVKRRI
jgi:hypothetical protein